MTAGDVNAGDVNAGDEQALEQQQAAGMEQQVEALRKEAQAHSNAVLGLPVLVAAVAYAGGVARGLLALPPPPRSLYTFAELVLVSTRAPSSLVG